MPEMSVQAEAGRAVAFDDGTSIIYTLDVGLRITYHNPSWDRFAVENGAPHLAGSAVIGQLVTEALPARLRLYYERALRSVIDRKVVWEHEYDCSAPGLYRRFHMRVLPWAKNDVIVVNSLLVETSLPEVEHAPLVRYLGADGIITMCAHCRRTQQAGGPDAHWDWVKEFVASQPARCSHGLCPVCFAYYYPNMTQTQ